jgi:hypothetical protein
LDPALLRRIVWPDWGKALHQECLPGMGIEDHFKLNECPDPKSFRRF